MKVATVLGSRPEIVRLSRVLPALDQATAEHVIVHTGSSSDHEKDQIFFDDLELRKPDLFLGAAGDTPCETVGQIIARADAVLAELTPDALLVLGDTPSCLAAYPAKRRRIPVFHMEAGNRCFDQRVPEEINRRLVDHIADINLPYSTISREYLLREGLSPDQVIKTGSPMYEVLHHYLPKIQRSTVLDRLRLLPREYFVVYVHREENLDSEAQLGKLLHVLTELTSSYGQRVIVSTHPRLRQRIDDRHIELPPKIELAKPMGMTDFVKLQMNARTVLSDSATLTEESSILNFPALNLREAHERPEGFEEGAVMLVGMQWNLIQAALILLAGQMRGPERNLRMVADYNVPNVSEKVVRIILSYTEYVNRTVWQKR